MRGRWGNRHITKEQREEILRVYLEDVHAGVALATSYGLSQIYAYKLAHERGLLPLTRYMTQNNVLFSGGAVGADSIFTECALKAGHDVLNFTFKCSKTLVKSDTLVILSKEELKVADPYLIKANEKLKRKFPTSNNFVNSLLRRNYYQVIKTNRVYAIAPIDVNGILLGGTAWAVQMAIDLKVPEIYVFDETKDGWYFMDGDGYWVNIKHENVPKPEGKYTGIGSRKLSENNAKSILNLYGE